MAAEQDKSYLVLPGGQEVFPCINFILEGFAV